MSHEVGGEAASSPLRAGNDPTALIVPSAEHIDPYAGITDAEKEALMVEVEPPTPPRADLDGLREHFLGGDQPPPFCRPGMGCRYCERPKCEWASRHAEVSSPDVSSQPAPVSHGQVGP